MPFVVVEPLRILMRMGRLGYGMSVSLDGYVNDADGNFDWSRPSDDLHNFFTERERDVSTCLYGRRMWETMKVWAEDEWIEEQPEPEAEVLRAYARVWRTLDKHVYSATLDPPEVERTTVHREFNAQTVRNLKESAAADLEVAGPTLAATLLRHGLVDEVSMAVVPVVRGSGTRFLPEGVRLDLSLVEEIRFASGTVFLRYAVR